MFGGINEEMENEMNSTMKNLIALLSSSDDLARTRACKSLIATGRAAVPLLVKALENSNYLGRWEVIKALGEIGDPTAAPALVRALEDKKFEVRWVAAEGLTKMDIAGLKTLLQALIKDANSAILREGAHHVLHHVLHNMARGELRNCLLPVLIALENISPSVEVSMAALDALESLERFQGAQKEVVSFKEFITRKPSRSVDLGPRQRARRYAKSLQYRMFYSEEPTFRQNASAR
jgi:HEAT repeat protein